MPSYKNDKNNTWYCKFYYKDWQDNQQQKKKSGFKTKKEAQAWERAFLDKQAANPDMLFSSLVEIYLEDMAHRLKETTMNTKKYIIELKVLPYFENMKVCDIKASHIRSWQNELIAMRDKHGKPYSQTYIKTVNNQLTAIFNYGVKYYGLASNPCRSAGSIGKAKAEEMDFWTKQEFKTFIEGVKDKPQSYAAFMTLYYTGMRIGELMALTPSDITDTTITINKSYTRLNCRDIITTPKTPKSNRTITIPKLLHECLTQYQAALYDLQPDARLFEFTKHFLVHEMRRGCKSTGVKKIRLHDLRHSHASLLIELGFSPLLIAERLGHEKVETTLNTYGHLYPSKQSEIATALDNL